jgi:hypothetical protein
LGVPGCRGHRGGPRSERANRLRDLAVIAEEHAAEPGVTDENFLGAIKTSYKQR